MRVAFEFGKKLLLVMLLIIWAGLYIVGATLLSILLGVPMWCISAAVVLAAVVWEIAERACDQSSRKSRYKGGRAIWSCSSDESPFRRKKEGSEKK